MGKIFVLSVTDHEEYILSRIMEIIAAEPGFALSDGIPT